MTISSKSTVFMYSNRQYNSNDLKLKYFNTFYSFFFKQKCFYNS